MERPKHPRPLSPHLLHWKWGIAAVTSITHRITGNGMALVGLPLLIWWVAAIADGPEAYAVFYAFAGSIFGKVILIGITFGFFQHLASGLRHLVMDIGAGFELKTSTRSSAATFVFSVIATACFWSYLLFLR